MMPLIVIYNAIKALWKLFSKQLFYYIQPPVSSHINLNTLYIFHIIYVSNILQILDELFRIIYYLNYLMFCSKPVKLRHTIAPHA